MRTLVSDMSFLLQLFLFGLVVALAVFLCFLALNLVAKMKEPPIWMPGENIFVNPITKEQHTFASLSDPPSCYLSVIIPAYNETKRGSPPS